MVLHKTLSDSKEAFHKEFPFVIPPIYRRSTDELLVELHLLSHQKNFKADAIFALGLNKIFEEVTHGYKPVSHVNSLFDAICNCNGFDAISLRKKANELINALKEKNIEDIKIYIEKKLTNKENIGDNDGSNMVSTNYYSRISAIGLHKLIAMQEHNGVNNDKNDFYYHELGQLLGYSNDRLDKDISLYKNNIEKMNQAIELINENNKGN